MSNAALCTNHYQLGFSHEGDGDAPRGYVFHFSTKQKINGRICKVHDFQFGVISYYNSFVCSTINLPY